MSIDSARIICTGCDYETSEVYRPIRILYLTSNGQTVATGRIRVGVTTVQAIPISKRSIKEICTKN